MYLLSSSKGEKVLRKKEIVHCMLLIAKYSFTAWPSPDWQ